MADSRFNVFFKLTKVDYAKREVWGRASQEIADSAGEVCDYETSKPNFLKWSQAAQDRTALLPEEKRSYGNLRLQHGSDIGGKVIALDCNDTEKAFDVGTYVSNDKAWDDVLDGIYTGFSIGGTYANRWRDSRNPKLMRYTANPIEISLVDSPAVPTATFTMIKADGTTEERKFKEPTLEKGGLVDLSVPVENAGELSVVDTPAETPSEETPQPEVEKAGVQPPIPEMIDPAPASEPEWVKAFVGAVDKLAAIQKATNDEKAAQEAKLKELGARVGIARHEGEPLTQPSGYPSDPNEYGDPANWSWPCDTKDRCSSALAYFNGGKGKDKYSPKEWNVLGRRIAQRAGKQIGKTYQYNPQSKQIDSKDNEKMEKMEVNDVLAQLNAALDVASDQLGGDPQKVRDLLHAALAGRVSTVDTGNPSAPVSTPTATQAVTPTMTATTMPPSSSSSSSSSSPTTAPTMTDETKAVVGKVDILTDAVIKLIGILTPQSPGQLPVNQLPTVTPQQRGELPPVVKAIATGGKHALRKAAIVAGTEEVPDIDGAEAEVHEFIRQGLMATGYFTNLYGEDYVRRFMNDPIGEGE